MASTATKVGGAAAAVVAAAAGLYVATNNGPYAGACVEQATGSCLPLINFIGGRCAEGWSPVVSCEDRSSAGYKPKATPVPAAQWCWYADGNECYKLADLGTATCPLGTVAVNICPPPIVKPTAKPTIPVPPISGPPGTLPTPRPTPPLQASYIELYHTNNASVLIIDGQLKWQQIHPNGNQWQVKLSYQSLPTISGGN